MTISNEMGKPLEKDTHVMITGGGGKLALALQAELEKVRLTLVDRKAADVTDFEAVAALVAEARPDILIHTAAYTDVDGCVREPALAYRVNGMGTQNVALACQRFNVVMVHISTNEVFAGELPAGYEEWVPPAPVNAYGRSKAAGEAHVLNLLQQFYIVRTAWLYAPGGHNFVHAILRRAREDGRLRVVVDEVGNPTNVKDLARAIVLLLQSGRYGVYHLANEGACSRWQFACEILRLAGLDGIDARPILSSSFKRASIPPRYGALRNINGAAIGITLRQWPEALADFMSSYVLPDPGQATAA